MCALQTYLIIFLVKIYYPRVFSTTFGSKTGQTLSWLVFVPKMCEYVCLLRHINMQPMNAALLNVVSVYFKCLINRSKKLLEIDVQVTLHRDKFL